MRIATAPAVSPRLRARAAEIAATAGSWVECAALTALCGELGAAVVGRPVAPGAHQRVLRPPTEDSGTAFANDVFALRAYCRCEGTVHGRDHRGVVACPANFEYFDRGRSVLRGEWFEHLGKGTVFTARPSVAELGRIRAACLASLRPELS